MYIYLFGVLGRLASVCCDCGFDEVTNEHIERVCHLLS